MGLVAVELVAAVLATLAMLPSSGRGDNITPPSGLTLTLTLTLSHHPQPQPHPQPERYRHHHLTLTLTL